jgi:DNA transformation protein
MEQALARAGIHTATELREIGADAAYARMLRTGLRPHFIGYYVLVMSLQGRPWNDCKGAEKDALRVRFDALVADTRGLGRPRWGSSGCWTRSAPGSDAEAGSGRLVPADHETLRKSTCPSFAA